MGRSGATELVGEPRAGDAVRGAGTRAAVRQEGWLAITPSSSCSFSFSSSRAELWLLQPSGIQGCFLRLTLIGCCRQRVG